MKNRTTQRKKIKSAIDGISHLTPFGNVSQGTWKLENKLQLDYLNHKPIARIAQEQNISVMFLTKYFEGLIEKGIIKKRRLYGNNRKHIVAAYKQNQNLNQSDLARKLGVSRQLVAKYIKGELQNAND
jgi:DNA-binding Lrp family transcriptional regulator